MNTNYQITESNELTTTRRFFTLIAISFPVTDFKALKHHCLVVYSRLYYVHSFAATEHFAVFFLGPVYTDLWSAFNSWQSLLSIKWAEDEPTHVKVK